MFKNLASQSLTLYAMNASTGLPVTGDAANQLYCVSKDDGSIVAIAANSGVPTEIDATNAKGLYKIALTQSETNGDKLLFTGRSSTSNVVVVPAVVYTNPPGFTALGITGSKISEVALVDALTTYTGNTVQTGDAFARIGALGAGLMALGDARLANLDAAVSTRSTYAGGAVASVTAAVSINLAQVGLTPRALDAVADSALTVGDALVAAICAAAGQETVISTAYTVKTPHTATPVRTFTLDSGSAPTTRS
jgi:hypothetical protein